jgi:1,4-alpha-glucan branching enzyme
MYDTTLKYCQLAEWDRVMNYQEIKFKSMIKSHQFVSSSNEEDKVIVYEKGDLLFVFNFNGF